MDEFDTAMKNAKKDIEPRKDFVETTMKVVSQTTPRRKFSKKIWIPSAVGAGVVVVAAVLLLPLLQSNSTSVTNTKQNSSPAQTTPTTNQQAGTSATTTQTPAAVPTAINDSSLQSDLNGVNASMNQESSDQTNADSNLNDSSQQITVPSS